MIAELTRRASYADALLELVPSHLWTPAEGKFHDAVGSADAAYLGAATPLGGGYAAVAGESAEFGGSSFADAAVSRSAILRNQTILAWVRWDGSINGHGGVLSLMGGSGNNNPQLQLGLDGAGVPFALLFANGAFAFLKGPAVAQGTSFMLTATTQVVSGGIVCTLNVDRLAAGSQTVNAGSYEEASVTTRIGCQKTNSNRFLVGGVFLAADFPRILAADELRYLYLAGLNGVI